MTATPMFFHSTDSNEPVQPPQDCLQSIYLLNLTSKSLPSSRATNKRKAQTAKNLLQEEADWRLHAMLEEAQYTCIQAHLKTIFSQHYKFLAMLSW